MISEVRIIILTSIVPTHCYFHGMNCRLTFLLLFSLFHTLLTEAQTTYVQFIHNSPDPEIETVDIWLNDSLWADNLNYHVSTPMIPLDTNSAAIWEIRNSVDSSITYYTWNSELTLNSKHIFVLHGQLNYIDYNPGRPLAVEQFNNALELSASSGSVDVLFFQGASELDSADIAETQLFQLTAFEQLQYGSFSSYINLFSADYGWGILTDLGSDTLGEFALPVIAQNWAGKAITVVTSGFINQVDNNFGHPLGMWATTREGGPMVCLSPLRWNLSANVQFIHNTSLAASDNIRIETDSSIWHSTLERHSATPFIPFPAGKDVTLKIRSNLLAGPIDSIWQDTIHLFGGRNYQFIWFDSLENDIGAQLCVHEWKEPPALAPNQMLLRFFNGSKPYDFINLLADTAAQEILCENIAFGAVSDTLTIPIASEEWVLAESSDSITTFNAPLDTLNLSQRNVTALTYSASNNATPSLWLCTEFGGPMHSLSTLSTPESPVFCTVQLIHASADTLLQSIIIRINDSLLVAPLSFETATDFIEVRCNDAVVIQIADNENPNNFIFSDTVWLTANQTHRLYLWGILNTQLYNPAPALDWKLESSISTESSVIDNVDVKFFHAATDLGTIDVIESPSAPSPIFQSLATGEFSSLQTLNAQNDLQLELRNNPTQFLYATYNLPLQSNAWENEVITLISTGFRQPANNCNGQTLQVWALTTDGNMIALDNSLHAESKSAEKGPQFFPNPVSDILHIRNIPAYLSGGTLQIRTSTGLLVMEKKLNHQSAGKNDVIDVTSLPNGFYTLTSIGSSKTESFRFCVCR